MDLDDAGGGDGVAISKTKRRWKVFFQICPLWIAMMVNWQTVRTFSLTRRGVVLAGLKFGWTSKKLKDCRYHASTLDSLNVCSLSVTAVIVVAGAAAVAATALK